MIELLTYNAYVVFGEAVYHQTQGIPTGINPAVFMANYYLLYYEYLFIRQLLEIARQFPPRPGGDMIARQVFDSQNQASSNAPPDWISINPENPVYNGNLAMHVLQALRFTRRYVDDLTAACNPFLEHLLYQNQHILGGLIRGIYPHGSLVLEPTNTDMWSFPTLDIRIISTPRMCVDKTTGLAYRYVHSHSVLYDKRNVCLNLCECLRCFSSFFSCLYCGF
jgi:hypothetical protein